MKYLLIILFSLNANSKNIRIGILGLTYHLAKQYDFISNNMPRKLDKNGYLVWHPELNISYINDNNNIFNFTYLKDCLNNDSFHIGYGKQWVINKNLKSGFILGLLKRKDPILISNNIKGNRIEYEDNLIPYPQIYLEKLIIINNNFDLSIQASSSIILTHINLGLSF